MRFTLDYDKSFGKTLDKLTESTGMTKAEIFRRSVASYYYLKTATSDGKREVAIACDGVVEKTVVLP